MRLFSAILISVLATATTSQTAYAKKKPKVIFSHPDFTEDQRKQNSENCDAQAQDRESDLRVRYYTSPDGGLGSKAAASFGANAAKGYLDRKEEFKIIEFCLLELGYKKSWLTDEEMETYKSLKKKARWPYLLELSMQDRPAETLIDPNPKKKRK